MCLFNKFTLRHYSAASAAAAAMSAAGKAMAGGKAPSLDAVLSQLVKRQAEPTFPEAGMALHFSPRYRCASKHISNDDSQCGVHVTNLTHPRVTTLLGRMVNTFN
jgi:hypothetical protein